jgi:hypothetical protein
MIPPFSQLKQHKKLSIAMNALLHKRVSQIKFKQRGAVRVMGAGNCDGAEGFKLCREAGMLSAFVELGVTSKEPFRSQTSEVRGKK